MPHSEYVSGSACLCRGLYEYTDAWLESNLGIQDSMKIEVVFEKFSSKVEQSSVPSQDITVVFDNMLEVRNACGESRLNGGMHYTKSVSNAYTLCEGIGSLSNDFTQGLWGSKKKRNIFH